MIQEFVKQWDENKDKLQKHFEHTEPDSYTDVVVALFTYVIGGYQVDNLTVLDHGDYQGTEIFILPKDTYQPPASAYVYTSNYYGSCSGCDLLQSVQCEEDKEQRVKEYMHLSLNLLQGCKFLSE